MDNIKEIGDRILQRRVFKTYRIIGLKKSTGYPPNLVTD